MTSTSLSATPDGAADASPPDGIPRCDNCEVALAGPFCHACGQRDVDHLASMREFLAHVAQVVFGYDSRLWRTVTSLFLRPGLLTAEYIAGRRARYLPPVQVYAAAATLLFIAASFNPMVRFDPARREFRSVIPVLYSRDTLSRDDVRRIEAEGMTLPVFGERFENTATAHLSTALVLLVPLFALAVAVTFLLDRRPFAHHVLFSLHWLAFYLALSAALQGVPRARIINPVTSFALEAIPFAYLVVALRRVYGGRIVVVLLRGAVLYAFFFVTLVLWLEVVTQVTARHI